MSLASESESPLVLMKRSPQDEFLRDLAILGERGFFAMTMIVCEEVFLRAIPRSSLVVYLLPALTASEDLSRK
jgi:hypothetical protein